jgi:SWI/SNF-related matrix-associated actin-dependent regulator 1 of chromatin subfamily A
MIAPMYYTLTPNCYKVSFQYHPMLVKCIRRIPSARYRADGKFWEVATSDIMYLQKMSVWAKQYHFVTNTLWLEDSEPVQSYEPLPMPVLTVPHNLLIEPYEYQKEGIAYALDKKRCIIGDEQGLGKTIEAIGLLTATRAFPALVICPASLKINWQREMRKFGGLNAVILDDKNRNTWDRWWDMRLKNGRRAAEVFIVNYESLRKFFVTKVRREGRFTLKSVDFDERIGIFRTVIIDESHKCKTSSTQQSKFVQGIAMGKEYILELTGTPVVNNNTDLIQQLNIMGRMNDFGGYTKFMARYCAGEHKSSHLKELNYLLRKNCFVRRLKKDVLTQLPDKTRSYLVTDIDNMKEYKEAERDIIKYLVKYQDADDEKIQRTIRGAIMVKMGVLKQISARGKVNGAIDIIHSTIDGAQGQKLIVFCYLKEVVAALKQEFREAVTVTGDDTPQQKQYAVDRFQTDERVRLIILNYKSGGVGLTLTAASNVLFVEFPWTAADCVQAEDRAHRNGQKNAVNCVYLLGQDTIDEYMYNLIQTKKTISDGVTGTDDEVQEHKVSEADLIFGAAVHLFGNKSGK